MNPIRACTGAVYSAAACFVFSAIAACAASAGGAGREDAGARIRYRFEPGKAQTYKAEFSQEFEVKGYSFYTLIDFEYTEQCTESLNDTLFTVEISLSDVSAQMKRNDELMDIGLDADMKDQVFIFKINKNGMRTGLSARRYMEDEKEVLDIMKVILGGLYPYLPDSALGPGSEWEFSGDTSADLKTNLDIDSKSTFKVGGIKKEKNRECLLISSDEEHYISGRVENPSGSFVMEGEGTGTGEFYFDAGSGSVIKLKTESTADITMIDASGSAAAERETYESHFVYTMKKELK
ncbi:MAG: hypothetical protein HY770_02140 [Chitinivibrionia bacterium]|nr:hypothetical protein [Chitinivibrionia bacterium]